jgi:hypothetical protein
MQLNAFANLFTYAINVQIRKIIGNYLLMTMGRSILTENLVIE